MQNLVLAVYFSIIRLRAICAVEVMASASSRMMSLKDVIEDWSEVFGAEAKICFVPVSIVSHRRKGGNGCRPTDLRMS